MKRIIAAMLCLLLLTEPFSARAAEKAAAGQTDALQMGSIETPPVEEACAVWDWTEIDGLRIRNNGSGYIRVRYDDHLDFAGFAVKSEPEDLQVTSTKVKSGEPEENVLTKTGSSHYVATATGTAELTLERENEELEITVRVDPAPISLLMITGHSIGAGQGGNAEQSVICEPGQAYSTTLSQGENLNAASAGIGSCSAGAPVLHAFEQGGGGTRGEGSGIAAKWVQETGGKVWILNSAVGGTSLNSWKQGERCYNNAVALFRSAEALLSAEITAGHYTLNHMGIISHTAANGDEQWDVDVYTQAFISMWNGFKRELAFDLDGDRKKETVEFIGLVPIWMADEGPAINNAKAVNYYMASADDFEDVLLASNLGRSWLTDETVPGSFKTADYLTQTSSPGIPQTMEAVFAPDRIHYQQAAYNELGFDIAENLIRFLEQKEGIRPKEKTDLPVFLGADGLTEYSGTAELAPGETLQLTPYVPAGEAEGFSYRLTGGAVSFLQEGKTLSLKAVGEGTATLTAFRGSTAAAELELVVRKKEDAMFPKYRYRRELFRAVSEAAGPGIFRS